MRPHAAGSESCAAMPAAQLRRPEGVRA